MYYLRRIVSFLFGESFSCTASKTQDPSEGILLYREKVDNSALLILEVDLKLSIHFVFSRFYLIMGNIFLQTEHFHFCFYVRINKFVCLRQSETHLVCLSCSAESATEALSLALHSVPRVFHLALRGG